MPYSDFDLIEQRGNLGEALVAELLVEGFELRLFDLLDELQQIFGHLVDIVLAVARVLRERCRPELALARLS